MPPSGSLSFAGLAYNFQPDGASFSPAVTITFTVPNAQWSQQYTIKQYDSATKSWVDLPTTYNPESGTVSSSVSHFCCIALFSNAVQTRPVTTPKIIIVKPAPLPTPAPINSLGMFYNLMVFVANLAMKNFYLVLVIIAIIAAIYLKGRRRRLDKIRYFM
jgi:hypothetical protein